MEGDGQGRARTARQGPAAGAAGAAIRRATPADAAALAALLRAVLAEGTSLLESAPDDDEERRFLEGLGERGVVHLAEDGEGLAGAQTVAPLLPGSAAFAHVATMGTWVAARCRRRGVGTALAAASFAAARELGYTKVFTDLRADNLASLAFHLSLGFRVVGVAREHARLGGRLVDVVYIERPLTGEAG